MANVRVTFGKRSREQGSQLGVQVNTFGLDKLADHFNGSDLEEIALQALRPSLEQALREWAVLTGASRDSIEVAVMETGDKHTRVVLQVGGEKLINDPRNVSHKDYAPYLEFNGSPSGSAAPGVIRNAIYDNDREIKTLIHEGVKRIIEEKLA